MVVGGNVDFTIIMISRNITFDDSYGRRDRVYNILLVVDLTQTHCYHSLLSRKIHGRRLILDEHPT